MQNQFQIKIGKVWHNVTVSYANKLILSEYADYAAVMANLYDGHVVHAGGKNIRLAPSSRRKNS